MLRTGLLAVMIMMTSERAWAQQSVGAGGQLQQIPPAPIREQPAPDIQVKDGRPAAAALPVGPTIRVRSLHVTGATLFPEPDLVAATAFIPNSDFDLAGLRRVAAKITAFYNSRGYFLAQAYVPEQDIHSGNVTIAVVEGRYGRVTLDNQTRLRDSAADGILSGLDSGDTVATAPLERRLLLLSDIPGIRVRSTLSPGTAVGTSDLLVDLTPGSSVTGSIEGDNAGNRYTGTYRAGATVNLNNPTGHGDVLSLRALTSFDGLAYGRASYQVQAGKATLGIAYSHIHYYLGREFKSLDASGDGDIASVYAGYPLIRSRGGNLNALVGVDAKWFDDRLGFISADSHRRTQVANIGVSGDEHDGLGGGGSSSYSTILAVGNLDIRGAADRANDAATARSNGSYGKVQFSFARLQTVAGPLSLYGSVRGQIAFNNLDISEKMELGGVYGVRAYPEGEGYGDQGYIATAEVRLLLPSVAQSVPGQFQLFGLIDTGTVDYNKRPFGAGINSSTRSAYGAGLSWALASTLVVKGTYAGKLGTGPATSAPDRSGRFWFQVTGLF
jgi:hemolysin activation/secretion protein